MTYDFERQPNEIVQDFAEHGTERVSAMAKELLIARSMLQSAEAQANALHEVIRSVIVRHDGPPSTHDFAAWVSGELKNAKVMQYKNDALKAEVERLRGAIESLRLRIRSGSEAAPWVVAELDALRAAAEEPKSSERN
jgi:hypothetical protein